MLLNKNTMAGKQDFNLIEQDIKAALEKYAAAGRANDYGGNAAWTKEIKRIMYELGKKRGYEAFAHNLNPDFPHEWLYDLVWYTQSSNSKDAIMTSMELAMECEWNTPLWEIQKDFEKLLQTNATYRLMVCYVKKKDNERVKEYFDKAILNYRNAHAGDRFMIAMMDENNKFECGIIIK